MTGVDIVRRTRRAVVTYDARVVQPEQLAEAIRGAGFRPGEPMKP